ncbi:CheR family methyltransferase [Jannaschia rubra]|uniref:protein-glutamate O-methyltransferase n=1 Tax=Jannaschia rubra TaxID=282197 RepID=A0A0M6XUZ1_9RHOB|nr:protein-glutamate O-methyltransferase CheR [Jannaschia rubra]CTQ34061.1 Chemotaxis protein methyltransferase [Jannaschia rubra]SFG24050.1 chemotaxis protein methyltransferase CheR [Jannaschia rubra]
MIPLFSGQYERLAVIADREAGLNLPESKRTFVASRLQRRLRATGAGTFDAYLRLVEGDGADGLREREFLVSALTTNVTGVYREPHHFDLLAAHLVETLDHGIRRERKYRIWSAGCSTGEEPLSLAATCRATLGTGWSTQVSILATDVDRFVLEKARDRSEDLELGRLLLTGPNTPFRTRAAAVENPAHLIRKLQTAITYMHHNLTQELDVGGQFDAIFCRNVLIYFSRDAQAKVHDLLRQRIAPGGLFAIGHSERLLGQHPPLAPAGRTAFRRPINDRKANGATCC